MKKIIFYILFFFLAIISLFGASSRSAIFLDMPVGWKQISMGGSGVAIGGEAGSGWFNPAGLMKYKGFGGSCGYSILALDRSFANVHLAWNIRNDAVVGLSWIHADAGHIPARDISGNYEGEIKFGDDAISLTFAKVVTKEVSLGGNIKYVNSKLSDISTYVVGFDVGAHVSALGDRLNFGLAYRNIAMKYQWNSKPIYGTDHGSSSDQSIPSSIRFGIAYCPKAPKIEATAEMEYSVSDEVDFRAGASFKPIENAVISAGIDETLPTFGASYGYKTGFALFKIGYALRLEREGLPPRHTFDLIVEKK